MAALRCDSVTVRTKLGALRIEVSGRGVRRIGFWAVSFIARVPQQLDWTLPQVLLLPNHPTIYGAACVVRTPG